MNFTLNSVLIWIIIDKLVKCLQVERIKFSSFDQLSLPLQVALPLESTTGTCFVQHYIESILALQEASCRLAEGLYILPLSKILNDFNTESVILFNGDRLASHFSTF